MDSTLSREVSPRLMAMRDLGTLSAFATTSITALFASPSTGAAVT